MESSKTILTKLFTEYYLTGTQAKKEGKPIAFITAFAPVEILRAMGVFCMYPESYAVVCAASKKASEMIHASRMSSFTQDLCSYSLIDFGTEHYERLPYGGLPDPDMLIATNNQCGTTLLWFKLLSKKKNIPLFIIDYPAAADDRPALRQYIRRQHESLVEFVQQQTSNPIDDQILSEQIANSKKTCQTWKNIHELNKQSPIRLSANKLINALFPIVAAKGTKSACDYYEALLHENQPSPENESKGATRLLWHGYPMWFLAKKFPGCFDTDFQIVLDDYTLWWDLDYSSGADPMEAMTKAYSSTYLNWPLNQKLDWVESLVDEYAIGGVICHANRSCRRALADIVPLRKRLSKRNIPSIIVESDMANPDFYSKEQVRLRIESFRETLRAS
ncbi:MAG: 2-hydroxyacyl-CoA dehydratase [Phycisphaerae bacterium]|nr:2-hydroxyacyl-CoA dehydratase [Phycisphaerae bacterium]